MTNSERTATSDRGDEPDIEAALRPFGWTCGPDFWQRYYSDPWVFSLANAVVSLHRRVERLRSCTVDDEGFCMACGGTRRHRDGCATRSQSTDENGRSDHA